MELPKIIYHSVKMKDIVEFRLQEHLTETFETLTTAYYLSEVDKDDLVEYHFHHRLPHTHTLKSIQGEFDFEADIDPIRLLTNMSHWILGHEKMTNDEKMDRLKCHYEVLQRYFPYPTTLYKEIDGDICTFNFYELEYDFEYDEMSFNYESIGQNPSYFTISNWIETDKRPLTLDEYKFESMGLYLSVVYCLYHATEKWMKESAILSNKVENVKRIVKKLNSHPMCL